jgi:hypothetical protein
VDIECRDAGVFCRMAGSRSPIDRKNDLIC